MQLRSQNSKPERASGSHETGSLLLLGPETPNKQTSKKPAALVEDFLLSLPEEVLIQIVHKCDEVRDLCALASTCKRMGFLVEGCSAHWRRLFQQAYCIGPATPVQIRAAELATSWMQLFRARCIAQMEVAPWEKSSHFEVQAAIEQMVLVPSVLPSPSAPTSAPANSNPNNVEALAPESLPEELPPSETCIVFLVDGSGSVTEQDFACMTDFMLTAAEQVVATAAPGAVDGPNARVPGTVRLGVIQFSNEVRVELPPTAIEDDLEPFAVTIADMQRMNGGTNIAAAVQKAGQLMKDLSSDCRRVMALLTDGRIDSYQAREAHEMTARLADEQGRVEMHAFGVGRGVDRRELLRIVSGACGGDRSYDSEEAASRYLPLMVLDDAPW